MNYPVYGNNNQFFMQELQGMRDRIDSQMRQIQQSQNQQMPQVTQNFQIAPQQNNVELESKYASNIDEVKNTFVIKTGLFVNRDFTTLWVKDVTGKIKTYDLQEIIEIDEKDKEILDLKKQIEDMKGMIANEYELRNTDVDVEITKQKPQGFKTVNELAQNNGNPQAALQQLLGNFTPEQKEGLFKQAKQYGCPDKLLSQLQNMK